jgi:hypothetical protein
MPKPTKQKRAGSPKLQLGAGKGILKQRTLLESTKPKPVQEPLPTPAPMAMDVDNERPPSPGPTDTQMETQDPAPASIPTHGNEGTTPSEPPHAQVTPASQEATRKSVVFDATNTVVEDVRDNEDSVTVVRKQLAPVFELTAKRKTTIFIKVRLPVENKPKDPTTAARTKLKELGEILIQQDPSMIIYKYRQTAKDEHDACTKLSQLPTTITGIQSYMNGFRPSSEGGDVWGNLRIGINSKADDFLENSFQEANMRKFWLRKAPLQAADTDYAGWLYLSTEAMHPEDTADNVNAFIKFHCAREGRPAFVIACERRMIWDDKAKAKELSIKEKQAKKALHFVCEKDRVNDAIPFIRAWLKSSLFKEYTNIPMKFIPNFTRGNGSIYNMKFGRAVQKHMQLTTFGTRHTLSLDFDNLDAKCSLLPGKPTLRKLILSMQTRAGTTLSAGSKEPRPPGPVFLAVDAAVRHSDRGSFVVTYTIDNAEEAEEKLKNILSYLVHEHGESATYWFNPTAIERADIMKWDEVNNRPITVDELDLDELLDDEMDWVANMEAASISFKNTQVAVTLARPSLLHKVSHNPLNGETDSVQTFHLGVSNLPTDTDGDNSTNRDAAIGDNSEAGDLEGSPAGAV